MENNETHPHGEITEKIIGVFFDVHNELGPGFLESVYHLSFAIALEQSGLKVQSDFEVPVFFRGFKVGDFEADIVVEDAVLLELKAVREFDPAHEAQILNYLRATRFEVGLLMNFGPKPKFRRFAYANERKRLPEK